eukprot:3393133-Amphidinium_carterae.2
MADILLNQNALDGNLQGLCQARKVKQLNTDKQDHCLVALCSSNLHSTKIAPRCGGKSRVKSHTIDRHSRWDGFAWQLAGLNQSLVLAPGRFDDTLWCVQ